MTDTELLSRINKCGAAIDKDFTPAVKISEVVEAAVSDVLYLITAKVEYPDKSSQYVCCLYYDNSDIMFMPDDWQGEWEDSPLGIEDIEKPRWVDEFGRYAAVLDGMPHKFVD